MSTPNSLPPQVVLYISTRSTKHDFYAGYILLNATATPDGKAQQLSAAPSGMYFDKPYTLKTITDNTKYIVVPVKNIKTNLTDEVQFMITHMVLQPPGSSPPFKILRLTSGKLTDYLLPQIKRNISIVSDTPKPVITTTVPSPALPPPLLTPAGGAGDPTPLSPPPQPMTPVAALTAKPTKVKKPLKPKQPLPPPEGDLSFHVARQLLDLARIRKTECPIIAEELTEGNTAAMPCGHLFSRLAIEESFKTERYRCPACRLSGMPTYV